jgi:malonyl CoA-acyl carrier protein transacylase
VPFGFSPLRSGAPMKEVSVELPLLDFAGVKMSELEDVIVSWLEAEGRIMAKAVAEHMLMCFRSQNPRFP